VLAALLGVLAPLGLLAGRAGAQAKDDTRFAPVDAPGPDLRLSEHQLEDGLHCPSGLAPGDRVVLLIHGTGIDGDTTWGWGYQPALEAAGIRSCTVDLMGFGLADVQVSAERVVYAIRTVREAIDGPIDVVGYSQGAEVARFGLRFWPDLRDDIDDLVLVGAPISGTTALETLCAKACAPAFWQFRNGSALVAAINSRTLTFPGIDVTSVYSYFDQIVTPNDHGQASTLPGATNLAVQDVCPDDRAEHVTLGMADPVAYAIALDAIDHDGPAVADRLPDDLCQRTALPGLTAEEAAGHLDEARTSAADNYRVAPFTGHEPELRCYVTATCSAGTSNDGPSDGTDDGGTPFGAARWIALGVLAVGVGFTGLAVRRHLAERRRRTLDID
jgi:hypothetical protein